MGKDDAIVVGRLDALGVHDGTAGSGQELNTALANSVDIVGEGEEGVGRTGDSLQFLHVGLLLLLGKGGGDLVEQALPLRPLARVGLENVASDKEVDGVGLVGTLGSLFEGKGEHSRVVTQPPVVGLFTGQSGAVNSRLLSGSETNDRTV